MIVKKAKKGIRKVNFSGNPKKFREKKSRKTNNPATIRVLKKIILKKTSNFSKYFFLLVTNSTFKVWFIPKGKIATKRLIEALNIDKKP